MQKKQKPIKKVAAIKYDPSDPSPKVIAKGAGIVADSILEKGKEHDIPLYEDPDLIKSLEQIDIGDMIPPELYQVVAEILIFVSDLDDLKSKVK